MKAKAVVIEVSGFRRHTALDGLDDLQAAVDGYIEGVPIQEFPNIAIFINEEGKFTQEFNSTATKLVKPNLRSGDYISGPMVVTGFDPETGNNKDLDPLDWLELLVRLEPADGPDYIPGTDGPDDGQVAA